MDILVQKNKEVMEVEMLNPSMIDNYIVVGPFFNIILISCNTVTILLNTFYILNYDK